MSDLELSDNESIGQVSDDEQDIAPTFTKKTVNISDEKLKEYDEEGNVIADYNEDDDEDDEEEEQVEDPDEDVEDDEEIDYDDEDMEDPQVTVAKKKIAKKTQASKEVTTLPDTQIELPSVFEKEDDDYDSGDYDDWDMVSGDDMDDDDYDYNSYDDEDED